MEADELQPGRDVQARQMKQASCCVASWRGGLRDTGLVEARIRDWLARKEAELEVSLDLRNGSRTGPLSPFVRMLRTSAKTGRGGLLREWELKAPAPSKTCR